jgi:hypothetical protein
VDLECGLAQDRAGIVVVEGDAMMGRICGGGRQQHRQQQELARGSADSVLRGIRNC